MKRWIVGLALCAAASAQVKLPPYSREVLPNGTAVYLVQKSGLPLVSFHVVVKGGNESEPVGMAGLAQVTAGLLRRGTAQTSPDQFNEELDSLGGTFGAFVNEQTTAISAEFLKKDFDRGLALVADAVLHPAFPEAEVKKALARAADGLKAVKDNPGGAIGQYYETYFYGTGHPYGRVADEASVDRIRRQDIAGYHDRMYVGKNLIVVVAGDFDAAAARKRVGETFGAAPAGDVYRWAEDHPPVASGGNRVLLVDKPDATQTYFIIAQPGVRRSTPDRVPLTLVNTLFGGRFTSMINEELRINGGLTYGASARVEMNRLTGGIYITSYTKTDTTAKAIDLALEVLKRLRDRGITAEQLASAKAYVKGTYPPQRLQTADQVANILAEMELYGLGRDEVDEYFQRIDAVTLEQANAVIRKHYGSENLTFVLLGNAAKIREAAGKFGKVTEKTVRQAGW